MASSGFNRVAATTVAVGTLLGSLMVIVSAQGTIPPDPCSWKAVHDCYEEIQPRLDPKLQPDPKGKFDDDAYAAACANYKPSSECYEKLAGCPDEIRANFTSYEDGYKAAREVICDKNAFQDVHRIMSCIDRNQISVCRRSVFEEQAEPYMDAKCREHETTAVCLDEVFDRTCPAHYRTAMTPYKRLFTSVLKMDGCQISSQPALVPHAFVLALMAFIVTCCSSSK